MGQCVSRPSISLVFVEVGLEEECKHEQLRRRSKGCKTTEAQVLSDPELQNPELQNPTCLLDLQTKNPHLEIHTEY